MDVNADLEADRTADLADEERRAWFRGEILPLRAHLHQYVRRVLASDDEVEDVVHETLIRTLSVSDFRRVASPIGFLKTVARNLLLDIFRRRSIVPIQLVADMETMNVVDEAADPETTWIGREELNLLVSLMSALPPQCQKVFSLRKVHGWSPPEIAAHLGLSVSTVEKHLLKAQRFCSAGLAREVVARVGWDEDGSRWQKGTGRRSL